MKKRRTSPCGGRSGIISNPGIGAPGSGGAGGAAGGGASAGVTAGIADVSPWIASPGYPYRFRPYCSWLDTQSSDEIAAASESSPASTTPAMISASLLTLPLPTQPSSSRHSRCVARPVPPPWVATISDGMVIEM